MGSSQSPWRRSPFEPGDVSAQQHFKGCLWIHLGFSRAPIWPQWRKTRAHQQCGNGTAPAPLCSSNCYQLRQSWKTDWKTWIAEVTELGCGRRMGRECSHCCDSRRCFTQHPTHSVIPRLRHRRGLWGNKPPLEQGEQSHEDGAQSAGDTAASAGGSAQEMLPREGLACRGLYFQRAQRLGGPKVMSRGVEKPLWDPYGVCDLSSILQGGLWEWDAACAVWQRCEQEQSHV